MTFDWKMPVTIREATINDAWHLARLINEAGEGLPAYMWSLAAAEGRSAFDVGEARAARSDGGFSFRNARVLMAGSELAAMMLGYRLPDPNDGDDLEALAPQVRPLVDLESQVPGSWYINAIATYEAHRRKGLGRRLMELADSMAAGAKCDMVSLIVASENVGARRLYERLGYRVIGCRPLVFWPGCPDGGSWVLMAKDIRG